MMDRVSGFLATRKGLLPFLGIFFVALNFLFRLAPLGWFSETDFFLHLGVILAIFGFTLAWAL
jgi:hypothetical protein